MRTIEVSSSRGGGGVSLTVSIRRWLSDRLWALAALGLTTSRVSAQQEPELLFQQSTSLGEGWQGFADIGFLVNMLLTLSLATALGAVIAYHPKYRQTADTLEEIEAPKVYMTYSVIGAIIGILVVKYGLVVGFVLFGIGGLIRFRTVLRTPAMTGQVIYVTLIGLSCGLDLPHVAVLATVFNLVLVYVLEARVTYRMDVRGFPPERTAEAAAAYRQQIEKQRCRILSEKKNPQKARVSFIFRTPRLDARERLERSFETEIDPALRGSVDWGVD